MVCAPVRSIIPSLKLGDYLPVQAHNPCSISHRDNEDTVKLQSLSTFSHKLPNLHHIKVSELRMAIRAQLFKASLA